MDDDHSNAIRNERREISDIGKSQIPTSIHGGIDSCVEIEDKLMQTRRSTARSKRRRRSGAHVSVIVEDVKTSHLSRGPPQICHKLGGFGGISGLSNSLENGSEDERDSSEELHPGD